ncbi:MAG: CAP domain-containing protein, partial [Patescibacteria group bacterium]|nr:CAP domain-containing protein [Patescibacteria group bacterium]
MRVHHAIKHFFIPHHGNNHRAKALHLDLMTIYILLFAIVNIGLRSLHQKFPDILGYATNIQVQQLLQKTNEKRIEAGLRPLVLNQQLSQAAAKKAQDMFAKNYWAHIAPDGRTPWDFILAAGYKYSVAGENLAKNFQDSESVVNAWMASPTHRDNILKSSYRDVGFAVVNGRLQG